MGIEAFLQKSRSLPGTERMPAIFIGHGSPLNGIEDNAFSRGWEALAKALPRPKAILSISAHWYTEGTYVHVAEHPRTIHDFWGFPQALYERSYPAPGAPLHADLVRELAEHTEVKPDSEWGIDHGTWIVLLRMYPDHTIPVFQMSIDLTKPPRFHYELGRELRVLRRKGVLIMGSGNIVHNLGVVNFSPDAEPFEWAIDFDTRAKEHIEQGDHTPLIAYEKLGHAAELSIPTPEHYLPLLYVLGLAETKEEVSFPVEGIAHSSVSMRSVRLG